MAAPAAAAAASAAVIAAAAAGALKIGTRNCSRALGRSTSAFSARGNQAAWRGPRQPLENVGARFSEGTKTTERMAAGKLCCRAAMTAQQAHVSSRQQHVPASSRQQATAPLCGLPSAPQHEALEGSSGISWQQPSGCCPSKPQQRAAAGSLAGFPVRGGRAGEGSRLAASATARVREGALVQSDAEVDSSSPHMLRPNLVDVLKERGLMDAVTNEEQLRLACAQPLKAYVGFDPTAESLHLGNLLGIIALAWAMRCGHTAVALLGGATARVGDPSGKSVERPVLDEETIARNTAGIREILRSILERQKETCCDEAGSLEIVNNYDWWRDVSLLHFLRDVGKYARVGVMMAKESVKKRLQSDEGMSFTEFTYQLLQGYDFVHLYREKNITVQMGGSDQWGNITAGTDLIRRLEGSGAAAAAAAASAAAAEAEAEAEGQVGTAAASKPQAFGLTWPLLLKSDGSKFGKSEGGAIWLAPSMLSPYKFYQYMFATPDADVVRFLRMLTFVELEEIDTLEDAMKRSDSYAPNTAQRRLAEEVTRFVHGEEGLQEAIRATQALAPGAKATELDAATLEAIAEDVPSVTLSASDVVGKTVVDVAAAAGLLQSKGAVRRLVKQGGVYLNNAKVEREEQVLAAGDLVEGRMLLLAAGKKNKMIVRLC